MKILIVDDSLLMRSSMKAMLETLGHTTILAIDAEQAIELYKEEKPDLVTMDLVMPKMNGITALRIILRINPQAKVIMSTSNGTSQLVIDALKSGALGYMLKPITINKLEEAFKKANIR